MFTGLIEAVGEVLTFEQVPGGARLVVATSLGSSLQVGESLAVNGVCLTVVEHNDHAAAFDLGPETSRVTALGTLAPGSQVNLERAMRADSRIGGHFVLGHVDGLGTVVDVQPEADFTWIGIGFPFELASGNLPRANVLGRVAREYELLYQPAKGQGKPARLVFHGWRLATVDVPFVLRDVPLR